MDGYYEIQFGEVFAPIMRPVLFSAVTMGLSGSDSLAEWFLIYPEAKHFSYRGRDVFGSSVSRDFIIADMQAKAWAQLNDIELRRFNQRVKQPEVTFAKPAVAAGSVTDLKPYLKLAATKADIMEVARASQCPLLRFDLNELLAGRV